MTAFTPVRYREGYLPIEDHGLIGDGTTAALVGRDGSISWMCVPRFDSPPLFCRILDVKRGGAFTMAPVDLRESRQFYKGDTGVLVTEMRCPSGLIRLTDAFSLLSGADPSEDVPLGAIPVPGPFSATTRRHSAISDSFQAASTLRGG
jgi:GH15 family glucan-1,4-alpha-glucosidase